MDAHQDGLLAPDLAAHQRDVMAAVRERLPDVALELAVLGGKARLGHGGDQPLAPQPVADQVGDRDEREPVRLGEAPKLGQPGHPACPR